MSVPGAGRPDPDPVDPSAGQRKSAPGPYPPEAAAGEPPVIEGEIVDDEPYRGARYRSGGSFGGSGGPFGDSGGAGTPLGGFTVFGLSGGGGDGRTGVADAMRMLSDSSPQVRGMLALPLRILAIAVAVPAVGALLLSIGLDGVPRWLAWVLAAGGAAAVVLLELRRKVLAGSPAPSSRSVAAAAGPPPTTRGRTGKAGLPLLIGGSLLWMMLTGGFDLLAILLMLFGAW